MSKTTETLGANGVVMRTGQALREKPIFAPARRGFRAGKRAVIGLAHPFRRYRLRRRLATAPRVENVVVICLGNICRSPYGHYRIEEWASENKDLEVRSGGLMGPDRPSPETAQSAAAKMGLDLTSHRSQLLTRELAAWADLIIVMSPYQARAMKTDFDAPGSKVVLLGDLDPITPDRRDVPDPLDRTEEFFLEVYDRMDRCLGELFTLIRDPS